MLPCHWKTFDSNDHEKDFIVGPLNVCVKPHLDFSSMHAESGTPTSLRKLPYTGECAKVCLQQILAHGLGEHAGTSARINHLSHKGGCQSVEPFCVWQQFHPWRSTTSAPPSNYNMRNLNVPYACITIFPPTWNSLPMPVVCVPCIQNFKTRSAIIRAPLTTRQYHARARHGK